MRRSLPTSAIAVLVALAAALPVGCGQEDSALADRPEIVATTSIAADIVRQVTGDAADVTQIVPDGASPHSYAPSAREQQELADSDLVVYFSPAL